MEDEEKDGMLLKERGILYAPDFVINAGGVINVYHELHGYRREAVIKDVEKIYDRLLEIFRIADQENIDNQQAAMVYAKKRMQIIAGIRSNYIPR